jgi:hypothetical protein
VPRVAWVVERPVVLALLDAGWTGPSSEDWIVAIATLFGSHGHYLVYRLTHCHPH